MKKTPKTMYLYPDKHAVLVFEERHPKSGADNRWAEIIEKIDLNISFHATNQRRDGMDDTAKKRADEIERKDRENFCLVFSRGSIGLVMKAKSIEVWDDNHSPALRERGITCRTIHVYTKDGDFTLDDIDMNGQGIHSSDGYILVPSRDRHYEHAATFDEHVASKTFGSEKLNVAKVHRVAREGSPA